MCMSFTYVAEAKSGKASYYASKFNGRKTASGEVFHNSKLTAASKSFKFGTRVKVTNVKNGKSVIVKINDTGKFGHGVVIDLSTSAFQRIAPLKQGIAHVKIERVK